MRRTLFLLILAFALRRPADAANCRYYLADQSNYYANLGFVFDLEADSGSAPNCQANQMKLVLGAADGRSWHWMNAAPSWQFDHEYTARIVIANGTYELWLDGQVVARGSGGIQLSPSPMLTREVPDWASAPTLFLLRQTYLRAEGGGAVTEQTFDGGSAPPEVSLFQSGGSTPVNWTADPGAPITIEAHFIFSARPDLKASSPFIDRYGQSRHAQWDGKVQSDDDLAAANADEQARLDAMPTPANRDSWGGVTDAGWQDQATGFYHIILNSGYWWLITPDGNPAFYTGICTAPALYWDKTPITGRDYLFAELPAKSLDPNIWAKNVWGGEPGVDYAALHTANLIRRYGPDWKTAYADLFVRRVRAFGFSGLGKWSDMTGNLPLAPVLYYSAPNLAGHPDVFDDGVKSKLRESLRPQIEPYRNDPRILGWSIQNEIDGIIRAKEVPAILAMGSSTAAKRAFVDWALNSLYQGDLSALAAAWKLTATDLNSVYATPITAPAADVEALRLMYESKYHQTLFETVKSIDPNHLYFGFWIVPGWWENEADWSATMAWNDAIGYDRYSSTLNDDLMNRLLARANKPVLLGEFSFPPIYGYQRGYGLYSSANAATDAAAGDKYTEWITGAARHPQILGAFWFQYRDEPLTGRGPGSGSELVYGEHYAFGIVDVTDRPKWDLVTKMRDANLGAVSQRMDASSTRSRSAPAVSRR